MYLARRLWIKEKLLGFGIPENLIVNPFADIDENLDNLEFHDDPYGRVYSKNKRMRFELKPNFYYIDHTGKITNQVNCLGYKGREFQMVKSTNIYKRILCIGDSNVYNGWPEELEKILNFDRLDRFYEVINGGIPGYKADQALERLKNSLGLKPDIVCIMVGWNDFFSGNNPIKSIKKMINLLVKKNIPTFLSTIPAAISFKAVNFDRIPLLQVPAWQTDIKKVSQSLTDLNNSIRDFNKIKLIQIVDCPLFW